ncbi:MAG TPA: histone deacetylase [bacterium (Candidatus Stahlbacteria)]|nr:histone deacetylase [Candidatus Stahlbacteria bacterium]
MKAIYSDRYIVDLEAHIFNTGKYLQVKEELLTYGFELLEPDPPAWSDLGIVHTREYLKDLKRCRRTDWTGRSELPIRKDVITAQRIGAGGTLLTCKIALQERIGLHIGGGLHHAYPDHAEGFCYINDVGYAVKSLRRVGRIDDCLIVDCDLHQGNGNAYIFKDDPSVYTFSIHQQDIYPEKEKSDLDIGLEPFVTDATYLQLLADGLKQTLNREYDLSIYIAGSDPYEKDRLGQLRLTIPGLQARDRLVLETLKDLSIPVAILMGGGYAEHFEDTVKIHVNTGLVALEIFEDREET